MLIAPPVQLTVCQVQSMRSLAHCAAHCTLTARPSGWHLARSLAASAHREVLAGLATQQPGHLFQQRLVAVHRAAWLVAADAGCRAVAAVAAVRRAVAAEAVQLRGSVELLCCVWTAAAEGKERAPGQAGAAGARGQLVGVVRLLQQARRSNGCADKGKHNRNA